MAVPGPSCSLWSWLHFVFFHIPFLCYFSSLTEGIFPPGGGSSYLPKAFLSSGHMVFNLYSGHSPPQRNHYEMKPSQVVFRTPNLLNIVATRKLYRTLTLATVGQNHPTITYFIMKCWVLYWKWKNRTVVWVQMGYLKPDCTECMC